MKIKLTKTGVSFVSLVKLFSIGYFIGMGFLMSFVLAVFAFPKWHQSMPGYLWLVFPVLIALQSFLIAIIVAVGIKLYGKVSKFEVSLYEEALQQTTPTDRR